MLVLLWCRRQRTDSGLHHFQPERTRRVNSQTELYYCLHAQHNALSRVVEEEEKEGRIYFDSKIKKINLINKPPAVFLLIH